MSSPFEDYKLAWRDKEYTIPARQIMGAISRVEDIVTLSELQVFFQRNAAPLARIAEAYAAVLRYAGASVTADEVYAGMFGNAAGNTGETVKACLFGLLELMVPPSARGNLKARAEAPEPPSSGQASGAPSSQKRSRSRAATRRRGS